MRALKYAGIALGVLLALTIATVGHFAYHTGWLREALAAAMFEKKQRHLAIDELRIVSLWPALGLRLEGIALSERASEQRFAAIGRAQVSVQVRPLLSGEIVVDGVALEGVEATLIRRADGSLNIADLLEAKEKPTPRRLAIADFRLDGGRLDWRDERGGGAGTLELALATGVIVADTGAHRHRIESPRLKLRTADVEAKLDAAAIDAGGGEVGIEGLKLDLAARTGEAKIAARLAMAASLRAAGPALTLERIEGQLDIEHPRLPGKALHLPVDAAAKADLGGQSGELHLSTRLDDSPVEAKIRASRFWPPALAVELDIARLDLDRYAGGGAKDGKARNLALPAGLELAGTLRVGELRLARMSAKNVRLQLRSADGRLAIGP